MFSVSLWLYLCELCNLHIAAGPRENILTWPVWGGNFWILLFEMAYCGVGLLCIFEWHWCPKHRGAQWKLFPSTSSLFPAKAIPKMTYTVSGGTLNPTHSPPLNGPVCEFVKYWPAGLRSCLWAVFEMCIYLTLVLSLQSWLCQLLGVK